MKNMACDLKIAFFGTSLFSVGVLDELVAQDIVPILIITTPDRPQGRKLIMTPPPVKVWAEKNNIDVLQPDPLDDDFTTEMKNTDWDLFIVASYGKILPKQLLDIPQQGTLNVHPSLLPKLRGASPIQTAILEDKKEDVGVSIILLDEQVDHGPIVAQASVELEEWPLKKVVLEQLLSHEGGKLLAETIPLLVSGKITPEEQKHDEATFTKQIKKEDGLIDLNGDAYTNYLKIRAFEGWPGTYFFAEKKENSASQRIRVKIVDADFKNGKLTITRVIPEGKKEMSFEDFLRGL